MINRLILGTVQFGMDYVTKQVPPDEAYKILDYAFDNGIDTLDTAYAYKNYELLSSFMKDTGKTFNIISKVKNISELKITEDYFPNMTACLTHGYDECLLDKLKRRGKDYRVGMSIYETSEIKDCDILQVPMKDEFLPLLNEKYHLRSIFGRGEKLKTKSVKECLADAFNTNAGKIVVGVDTLGHLEEIVGAL